MVGKYAGRPLLSLRRTIAGRKRGRRFKAAGANETQRVRAGCFVRGLSCARQLGFGAKKLRWEERSGTFCENFAATQGLGVESLRRGGCWGKISRQARNDRGVVRDERSPGGAGMTVMGIRVLRMSPKTSHPRARPGMTVMGVPDKEPHKDLLRNHIRTCHRNLHWIDADGGLATFSGGWRGGGTFRG